MLQRVKKYSQYVLVVGLFVGLYWMTDVPKAIELFSKLNWWLFIAALSSEWIFYAVESLRIKVLADHHYSFWVILKSRLLSVFVGTFLPGLTSAEVIRIFLLDLSNPGKKVYLTMLLLANRLYGLLSLGWILAFAYFFTRDQSSIPFHLPWVLPYLGLAVGFIPLIRRTIYFRLATHWMMEFLSNRIRKFIFHFYQVLGGFSKPRPWIFSMLTSTFTNSLCVLQFYVLATGLGIEKGFLFWAMVVPTVAIAAFLPLGMGAIGTQDLTLVSLAKYMGEPIEPYVTLSLLIHFMRIAGSLPGAFFTNDLLKIVKKNPLKVKV